jgi:hypothetical protein
VEVATRSTPGSARISDVSFSRKRRAALRRWHAAHVEEGGHDHAARVEAEVDRGQVAEAADEERGRDDENHGDRDLAGHEGTTEPGAMADRR